MSSIGPRNRIFRIGVKSGSSNQREEARGFSQVNVGLLFPRIRNRGPRIENRGSRKRFRNNVLDLCNSREKADGQRRSCKQGTFDSSNKGVMADMDTFVTSYDRLTNAGSDSALFKFRQPFWIVTNLRNHNIEHSTKELCAGMPSLCLRTSSGEWRSLFRFLC